MSLQIGWGEIILRLLLAAAAGLLVGLNRGEHGQAAGLRTTLLVCLAAAISMVQMNLLLGVAGKRSDSFVVMDVMRLPLGILSGMGFIGAGAILRKGALIRGVTTAATLWYVTVMGLCFGGGQLGLGLAALLLALAVLWALKGLERWMRRERQGTLVLLAGERGPSEAQILDRLEQAGVRVASCAVLQAAERRELRFAVTWRARDCDVLPPAMIGDLSREPGISSVQWDPADSNV